MKLSSKTLEVLKNFSAINPNMLFKPGKVLQTVAEAKNIMASATIDEEIPQQFGIFDLTEFLATLSLVDEPTLEFDEKYLVIRDGSTSIRYFYASPESLTTPPRQVSMPKADVQLKLSADVINRIKRASSVLGHASLEIEGKNGVVKLNVVDMKNPTANTYSVVIDENNACKELFSFIIVIGNLKMLPGDYNVGISSKLISHFTNASEPVEYWLALEKTSHFGTPV